MPARHAQLSSYVLECLAVLHAGDSLAGLLFVTQLRRIEAERGSAASAWLVGVVLQLALNGARRPTDGATPPALPEFPKEADDVRKLCLLVTLGVYTPDQAALLLNLPEQEAFQRMAQALRDAAC